MTAAIGAWLLGVWAGSLGWEFGLGALDAEEHESSGSLSRRTRCSTDVARHTQHHRGPTGRETTSPHLPSERSLGRTVCPRSPGLERLPTGPKVSYLHVSRHSP